MHDILNTHLDDGKKILEILTAFAEAKGVDVVPVIRCNDCVYLGHRGATHFDGVDSGYLCSRTEDDEIELTDYCSKARRKEE